MKTQLLLPFLFLSFHHFLQSQCVIEVMMPLQRNKVKANILTGGGLFWDRSDAQFVVPYTPGALEVNTIFAGSIWLSAFDQNGDLNL
jgi:hypothetical protein